jgi:GNAT superfamily N-acetyltransferase
MGTGTTRNGVAYDSIELDRIDRRFWREIWESVPAEVAAERGIEWRRFGPIQVTVVRDLGRVGMMNLVLGTAEAEERSDLEAALAWAEERSTPYVSVTPDLPGSAAAETWLRESGLEPSYAWMKFVRDPHPPRFPEPDGIEVVEVNAPDEAPFGTIAALGFGMPAWGAEFFAHLPGRPGWRCYVARVGGEAQACGAMLIAEGIAELGIGATLEEARGRGCQTALLRRRITDAAAAGCRTLLVETGERVPDRPAVSYRNILKAGFEEAYLRPNWKRPS